MKNLISKIFKKLYYLTEPKKFSSSISDNQAYPQVCNEASLDYHSFNQFRSNPIYNEILEHVSEKDGEEYLKLIRNDAQISGAMPVFKPNDDLGNPRMHEYPDVGTFSPNTLRYIKVLTDLKKHFRTLDLLDICEIGVGYGGQCRVINAFFKPATYTLVDIKPALALTQRFLDHFVLHSVLRYRTMNELARTDYDLVVSNYAFTETPRVVQNVYLDRIILRSKRGYITYNEISPPEFHSYRADELLGMIPGSMRLPEEPLIHQKNCIIVWGVQA